MKKRELARQIKDLQQDYRVKWSFDKQYVMIMAFRYPEGWSPRTAPLFFDLPSTYPRKPPDVYIPPDSEYEAGYAEHLGPRNDDGWQKWCIIKVDWDPETHDLVTMTEMMKRSLRKPNDKKIV